MKRKAKSIIYVLVSILLVVGLIGCSNKVPSSPSTDNVTPAGQSTSKEKTVIKIAYSVDKMTEGVTAIINGLKEGVRRFNEKNDQYEMYLYVADANASVEKQIADVETMIVDGFDYLLFACVDTEGSWPAVKAATDAGIKVIDVKDMGRHDQVELVVNFTNEDKSAAVAKEWLQKRLQAELGADPNFKFKFGIIYGAAAQTLQLKRGDFIKEWAEEDPDHVEVVAWQYGDWDTAKSQGITEDWIQANPEINFYVCANTAEALGTANALVAAGLKDDVGILTFDITYDALDRIREGALDCTVGKNSYVSGIVETELIEQLYFGTYKGDKNFLYEDQRAIDKTNLDAYLEEYPNPAS